MSLTASDSSLLTSGDIFCQNEETEQDSLKGNDTNKSENLEDKVISQDSNTADSNNINTSKNINTTSNDHSDGGNTNEIYHTLDTSSLVIDSPIIGVERQTLKHKTSLGEFGLFGTDMANIDTLITVEKRAAPLSEQQWKDSMDPEGRIQNKEALFRQIGLGGVSESIRAEVWKFLLGYFPFDSTHEQRQIIRSQKRQEYFVYKNQWKSITEEQERNFFKFQDRRHRIQKDVVRTDRLLDYFEGDDNPHLTLLNDILLTYSFYNFNLGYIQGMNDLVSVLLILMEDEVDTFWCFKGLMQQLASNFDKKQSGIHKQLEQLAKFLETLDNALYQFLVVRECANMFFCFRWLLILFKREFSLEDVTSIWEAIWSHNPTDHFQLFIALAILITYRDQIMSEEENMQFEDILKFLNELAYKIDKDAIIYTAEYLLKKYRYNTSLEER